MKNEICKEMNQIFIDKLYLWIRSLSRELNAYITLNYAIHCTNDEKRKIDEKKANICKKGTLNFPLYLYLRYV